MVTPTVEQRQTGAENVLWDLSVFYAGLNDPQIEADMARTHALADAFAAEYRGRVAALDAEEMRDAIEKQEAIEDSRYRLYSFASLNYATDTANPKVGALFQKVQEFASSVGQKTVFFELEWNNLDDDAAKRIYESPVLEKFRFQLESGRRFKPHQLSEIEEQLMMEKSVTGRSAWVRFFTQLTSAIRIDWDGQTLNMQQTLTKLYNEDRAVRQKASELITAALKARAMELSYVFNVLAADKASDDKRRGYESWIASRNLDNLAPSSVVDALVNTVTANYELVARHYRLKRALLGLDTLTEYDRYAPIPAKDSETFYTWEEAKAIVLKAFRAFDARVADVAEKFFNEHWIHAAILPNKRGGAFASPTVPSAHPFVFVNYEGTADNVKTLAHELGHGLHMYLSGEAHGFQGLYTPLTTAEMASTFAEMLVFEDLMAAEPDAKVRLSMLANKIEDSFATIFRQTAMNRFEDAMHTARRTEGELTPDRLGELWMHTQQAMFGDSVTLGENYKVWWSYIPHFLQTPGYVYAYAFGELLVLALFNLYKERGADFVPQYIAVLEAGGSDYPDAILSKVGVDLNDPNLWESGIAALRALVEEEERLAREVYPEKF